MQKRGFHAQAGQVCPIGAKSSVSLCNEIIRVVLTRLVVCVYLKLHILHMPLRLYRGPHDQPLCVCVRACVPVGFFCRTVVRLHAGA